MLTSNQAKAVLLSTISEYLGFNLVSINDKALNNLLINAVKFKGADYALSLYKKEMAQRSEYTVNLQDN